MKKLPQEIQTSGDPAPPPYMVITTITAGTLVSPSQNDRQPHGKTTGISKISKYGGMDQGCKTWE